MAQATLTEVVSIYRRARAASAGWGATPLGERLKAIRRLRRRLYLERDQIAQLLTEEIGKPIQLSYHSEIFPALYNLDYLVKKAPRWLKTRRVAAPWFLPARGGVRRDPLGVIAILGTWNYPLLLNLSPLTFALAAGNAVVFKPSEQTSLIGQKIENLFRDAGFPEGVVEVVYGGAEVGEAVAKGDCDKCFFTGSVEAGRQVHQRLSERGKPCVLELSGNNPLIVRRDAPLGLAARAAVWGAMLYSGQNCIATKRILVDRRLAFQFQEKLLQKIRALKLGPAEEWKTDLGPLKMEKILLRCEELVKDAVKKGAQILIGGKRAHVPFPGHFFEPTLLARVTSKMKIWTEDFFGPVAILDTFDSDEEAVEKANTGPLGLGAAIFSRNRRAAEKMASALQAGVVSVNEVVWPVALPMFPFGGVKASGFGRVRGEEGMLEMVNVKSVFARSARPTFRPHYFSSPYNKNPKVIDWIAFFFKK